MIYILFIYIKTFHAKNILNIVEIRKSKQTKNFHTLKDSLTETF